MASLVLLGMIIVAPRGSWCEEPAPRRGLVVIQVSKTRDHVEVWVAEHHRCPRIVDLAPDYTPDDLVDWWGTALSIACEADGAVIVRSVGPDRVAGTADDVVSR